MSRARTGIFRLAICIAFVVPVALFAGGLFDRDIEKEGDAPRGCFPFTHLEAQTIRQVRDEAAIQAAIAGIPNDVSENPPSDSGNWRPPSGDLARASIERSVEAELRAFTWEEATGQVPTYTKTVTVSSHECTSVARAQSLALLVLPLFFGLLMIAFALRWVLNGFSKEDDAQTH